MHTRGKEVANREVVDHGIPQNFLQFLEATTDCVFIVDRQWRFTFLNKRAIAEIACGRNLLGAKLWEIFPEAADSAL